MPDKAMVIFHNGAEVSPTIYLHSNGPSCIDWLREMGTLDGPEEAAARYIAVASDEHSGPLSLWNTPPDIIRAITKMEMKSLPFGMYELAERVLADYSHGYAGVVLVDTRDGLWQQYGQWEGCDLEDHD